MIKLVPYTNMLNKYYFKRPNKHNKRHVLRNAHKNRFIVYTFVRMCIMKILICRKIKNKNLCISISMYENRIKFQVKRMKTIFYIIVNPTPRRKKKIIWLHI